MLGSTSSCIVLTILVTNLVQYAQASHGQNINVYLVEHEKSGDAEDNLKIAAAWLEQKIKTNTIFDKGLIKDLKTFVSLAEVRAGFECNDENSNILRAVGELIWKDKKERIPRRRIELVWQQVAEEHSRNCQNVYIDELNKKLRELNPDHKTRALSFAADPATEMRERIKSWSFEVDESTCKEAVATSKISTYRALGYVTHDQSDAKFLKPIVDQRSGKSSVDKKMIEELIQKYLVKSCRYYYDQLAEIFLPATSIGEIRFVDEYKDREFNREWATFKICGCLANYSIDRKLIDGVAEIAEGN